MAEKQEEKTSDKKVARRSRWTMAGLHLPSLSGRSSSQERPSQGSRVSNMGTKITFWKRRTANITDYDPTYRVVYLGNVLTGWAKGDGCVDKPLSTLWRNHIGSEKADIVMKVTIVGSGLRAVTKEHGLTEYWANRITYCTAHPSYPRVFCWIYRHEGRKMKQELRCHAVLCPKEDKAKQMSSNLTDRLHQALVDFKKDKINRQNARLSLANSIHSNPSMPYRKLLLQAGTCNYKPPIERSKSAPKLSAIEEADLEEEDDYLRDEVLVTVSESLEAIAEVHPEPSFISSLSSSSPLLSTRVPLLPNSSPPSFHHEKKSAIIVFDEDNSDDEDEIKDYIGMGNGAEANLEADSATSISPTSQGRSSSSCSPGSCTGSPSEDQDCHSISSDHDQIERVGKVSEQDTISDESGYSEEPCSHAKEVTVVRVNINSGETPASDNEFHLKDEAGSGAGHRLEISVSGDQQTSQQITITSRAASWSQPVTVETEGPTYYSSSSGHSSRETSPRTESSAPSEGSSSPEEQRAQSPSLLLDRDTRSPSPTISIPLLEISPLNRDGSKVTNTVSTSPRLTDLSVKSVLLSEFTSSEKIRYIERSSVNSTKSTMVLNRQEFCINI